MSLNVIRRFIEISKMTDEEKKKKREKSWFEEFLYNVMMECTRIAMDYFFDEFLGQKNNYNYIDWDDGAEALQMDEMDEWEF